MARSTVSVRSSTLVVAAALALVPVGPTAVRAATEPPPAGSQVVPYVNGTSIEWRGTLVPVAGAVPYPSTTDYTGYAGGMLTGVSGGPGGIVVVGWDNAAERWSSWTSGDVGASWTEHPSAAPFADVVARRGVQVTYAGGLRSSTDGGTTWRLPRPSIAGSTGVVATGLVGFVAISHGTATRAWYSSDGLTWHLSPYNASLRGFCPTAIAAGPTVAVALGSACGGSAMRLFASTDGRAWRPVAVPSGVRYVATLSYVGGRFLIIGPYGSYPNDGTAVWVSTNGTTWTRRSFVPRLGVSPDVVGSVVRFGTGWVAVGYGAADAGDCLLRAWKTPDLVHWSRMPLPSAGYSAGYCDKAVQAVVTGGRLVVAGYTSGPDPTAPLVWIGRLVTSP